MTIVSRAADSNQQRFLLCSILFACIGLSRDRESERSRRCCGSDRRNLAALQSFYIPHRRLAKEAAVLTAELAHAFVANFICRARRIKATDQHSFPGRLQSQLF